MKSYGSNLEELILEALGEGEHHLQAASPGPPSLVSVKDYGHDDDGEHVIEVEVIDPASENHIGLEAVAEARRNGVRPAARGV